MTRKSSLSLLLLTLAVLAMAFLLFLNLKWEARKDILYLKDNRVIVSDNTSEGDKLVYYQENGVTRVIPKDQVEYIGYNDTTVTTTGKNFLASHFAFARQKVKDLIQSGSLPGMPTFGRLAAFFRKVARLWPAGFLIFLVLGVFLTLRSRRRRGSTQPVEKSRTDSAGQAGPAERQLPVRRPVKADAELSDIQKIVKYFLELFRVQIGAPPEAVSELYPVEARTIGSNQIYQLRILHNGEWAARRMSVGPLGENTGSKSKCFYVIYDVHLVVKMPPKPVQDFQAYLDSIKREHRIVEKLAPKECIIPRTSVILQLVYTFPGAKNMSIEKMEEKYVRLMEKRPALQEYLKIGGNFVFFMDLSRYFFLGHIIDTLHDIGQKSSEEIRNNPGMIWDVHGFPGRYGSSTGSIREAMDKLYVHFETDVRTWLATIDPPLPVQQYQIKKWFLQHLTGKPLEENDKLLSTGQVRQLNQTAEGLLRQHSKGVQQYRRVVKKYVRDVSMAQNRSQIESIIANTLMLLVWLRDKQVAMRDLKPDNLLVAGDPKNFPHFLNTADQFSIGLIDVETAVDYAPNDPGTLLQPQLGGTPNYATPTHLFDNPMLERVYGKIDRTLHLQDWQATIAILFKTVTGKTLFQNTGKLFPLIIRTIQQSVAEKKSAETIIREANQIYWQSARDDLRNHLRRQRSYLESFKIRLPETVKQMLREELFTTQQQMIRAMKQTVQSQTAFPEEKRREQLLTASLKTITALREKWESRTDDPNTVTLEKVRMLKTLERMKQVSLKLKQHLSGLDKPGVKPTIRDILQVMFAVVYHSMHKPEWEPFTAQSDTPPNRRKSSAS